MAAICEKWEVRANIIGHVTAPDADGTGRLRIREGFDGPILADVPATPALGRRLRYEPAMEAQPVTALTGAEWPEDCQTDLLRLLGSPRWVFEQYDHQLFLNTVAGPGSDAALLRLAGPGLPRRCEGWP